MAARRFRSGSRDTLNSTSSPTFRVPASQLTPSGSAEKWKKTSEWRSQGRIRPQASLSFDTCGRMCWAGREGTHRETRAAAPAAEAHI